MATDVFGQFKQLYVNGRPNFDEVLRRLSYWVNCDPSANHREPAIKILVELLQRERKNFYYEEN